MALVVVNHLSNCIASGGKIGVDMFFVLSGFLITGVLLREQQATGRISLSAFYVRRFLRLMPALLLVVAGVLVIAVTFGSPSPHEFGSAGLAASYLVDLTRAFGQYSEVSLLWHTWSLSVEEHFYILWPLALGVVLTEPARYRAGSVCLAIAAITGWRVWLVMHGASADWIYYGFDTRSDELLMGCAAALWITFERREARAASLQQFWPLAFATLLVVTFAGAALPELSRREWLPLIVGLASVVLVLELVNNPAGLAGRIASHPVPVYLGRISYGIYLWHYPLLIETRYLFPDSKGGALVAVAVAVAIGMAAASHRFVEPPFLRLKRSYERDGPARPQDRGTNHQPRIGLFDPAGTGR